MRQNVEVRGGHLASAGVRVAYASLEEHLAATLPSSEMGRPEEIATVPLFLASNDSSFVNGIERWYCPDLNSPDIKISLSYPVTLGRVPGLNFGGAVAAVTGYGPYNEFNRNQNFFDNCTKIAAKHTFKAGFTAIHYTKQENAASATHAAEC